uniref:General transcription factor IIE subunit 1 n=1 Tax=Culicoides sonorensis TaxID=179676 RepID=A0A336M2K2_CULSO
MSNQQYVTEIPSSLKQLARLVVRGFHTIEDALIIDMLVRNPCMKEDDLCELLKFERKMLRAKIATLRNDKFIQIRLKMETGPDGKAQKANYYFINYKTFVNVVKYKLDLMRKRMETEERDATSRASFKCTECLKTFTDLEADQLFNPMTQEFRCTFCGADVEEDSSALPKKDSRQMLARFNEQMQPLYDLLQQVEDIKLAPELLEPEPTDLDTIRGINKQDKDRPVDGQQWSGEQTRSGGFLAEETRVDVSIGENDDQNKDAVKKDRPIWMTESTVITNTENEEDELDRAAKNSSQNTATSGNKGKKDNVDIMSVLLANEKNHKKNPMGNSEKNDSSDSDSDGENPDEIDIEQVPDMNDSDEEDHNVPKVLIGKELYPIDEIDDTLIAKMTPQEKEVYIQVYQDHFSLMYE